MDTSTQLALQQIGTAKGISGILDAIYGTNLQDIEDNLYDKLANDKGLAVAFASKFINYTPGAFITFCETQAKQ